MRPNPLLLQFAYLQLLDLLTTLVFLLHGMEEGNPFVRFVLSRSADPLQGLVAIKAAAIVLGLGCWLNGRARLLRRINVLFAIVVAWNLLALVAGSFQHRG